MFLRINKALNDRRAGIKREEGFTLIELLVVVIIIGILAAIAIPVFLGVQSSAKDSAVKSDLTNLKTAAVAWQTDHNGVLPTSIADLTTVVTIDAANYKAASGEPATGGGAPVFSTTATGFCIDATASNDHSWMVTDITAPKEGSCS